MDPMAIAGMVFSLLVLTLIGGFILLFPLSRRLGRLMEQRLDERALKSANATELAQLNDRLLAVQEELRRLAERQEFTDSLLAARDPLLLDARAAAAKSSE
ncbi:MAG TPA: hypothetical protein VFQ39_07355 [Longimicrobium sp.]|nr:hypothetical protein [Longimicrobium sp.]